MIPGSILDDPATPDDDTQLNQLGTGWFYWWSERILQYVNLLRGRGVFLPVLFGRLVDPLLVVSAPPGE